jgi:hypothetical protein
MSLRTAVQRNLALVVGGLRGYAFLENVLLIFASRREQVCADLPFCIPHSHAGRGRLFQNHMSIGAAKAEAVGHHRVDLRVVDAFAGNRKIGEFGIDFLDVGTLADEARFHHQDRVDRLLDAGRAQRMTGQRLGGGDRRHILAAHRLVLAISSYIRNAAW